MVPKDVLIHFVYNGSRKSRFSRIGLNAAGKGSLSNKNEKKIGLSTDLCSNNSSPSVRSKSESRSSFSTASLNSRMDNVTLSTLSALSVGIAIRKVAWIQSKSNSKERVQTITYLDRIPKRTEQMSNQIIRKFPVRFPHSTPDARQKSGMSNVLSLVVEMWQDIKLLRK